MPSSIRRVCGPTSASEVKAGTLDPAAIDEGLLSARLSTGGQPDPDLLIRTGGEMRVSNFLLWQMAYTELFFTDTLWPDFRRDHLFEAIRTFAARERRFGQTSEQVREGEGEADRSREPAAPGPPGPVPAA